VRETERTRLVMKESRANYDRHVMRAVHVSRRPGSVWDKRLAHAANGVTSVGPMEWLAFP